jgi:hypothetical protein
MANTNLVAGAISLFRGVPPALRFAVFGGKGSYALARPLPNGRAGGSNLAVPCRMLDNLHFFPCANRAEP